MEGSVSDGRQNGVGRVEPVRPGTQCYPDGRVAAVGRGWTVYRTIVVGTDGSSTADRAVDVAGGLARVCGAAVHVVTASRPVRATVMAGAAAMAPPLPSPAWLGDDERVAAEEVVRRAGERLAQAGVSASAVARLGEPADALLAMAEEVEADLIVVGNRGMTGMRRYLLGSVADRVAHHAPCSVHIAHTC
jgi:nucleotide-binding universal stress UspA family protein